MRIVWCCFACIVVCSLSLSSQDSLSDMKRFLFYIAEAGDEDDEEIGEEVDDEEEDDEDEEDDEEEDDDQAAAHPTMADLMTGKYVSVPFNPFPASALAANSLLVPLLSYRMPRETRMMMRTMMRRKRTRMATSWR